MKSKPRQPSPRLRTLGSVYTLAPQIVVHGPGASASPGSQGEMQNLGSHPTPTDFASAILSRSPSDSFVHKSLRNAGLGLSLGAGASTQSQIPTPHPSLSSRGQRARLQNHPSHLPRAGGCGPPGDGSLHRCSYWRSPSFTPSWGPAGCSPTSPALELFLRAVRGARFGGVVRLFLHVCVIHLACFFFCFEQGVGFVSLNDTLVACVPAGLLRGEASVFKHQGSATQTWGGILKAV